MVKHNEAERRFESETPSGLALLDYTRKADVITFRHTEVPEAEEGAGIASELVRASLDFARESKLKVIPRCPFVATYIQRHPEYSELLAAPHG